MHHIHLFPSGNEYYWEPFPEGAPENLSYQEPLVRLGVPSGQSVILVMPQLKAGIPTGLIKICQSNCVGNGLCGWNISAYGDVAFVQSYDDLMISFVPWAVLKGFQDETLEEFMKRQTLWKKEE